MKNGTVLLVDDEKNLVNGLRRSLRKEPYKIVTANSAEDALGILDSEEVDVVVSDQQMPGMQGTQFLQIVKERYPETIRFMLTGNATLDTAIEAINEGAISKFFQKPCSVVDLAVTIEQFLQHKKLMSVSKKLYEQNQQQKSLLEKLEAEHPGITAVPRDESGTVMLDETGNMEGFLAKIERELEEML